MKTVYLLTHIWSDYETHYDTIGVYETKELAEKASEEYGKTYDLYDYSELDIEEVPLNRFTWEKENRND